MTVTSDSYPRLMTYSAEKVRLVGRLLEEGLSQAEISRRTGVSRYSIQQWGRIGIADVAMDRHSSGQGEPHDRLSCSLPGSVPHAHYAYLLGLYLGDGCISTCPKGVFQLRAFLDLKYPGIIHEAASSMGEVLPNRVGLIARPGCMEVHSSSKHWPCLFPQHGVGRKHLRDMSLRAWQYAIGIEEHPRLLLRGLIHSDGSRFVNWVKGRPYVRYMFANKSADILGIFGDACDAVGVSFRRASWKNISVARRESVSILDSFVGPKG